MAADPNYQLLYQLNPGMFAEHQSLADALYGTGPMAQLGLKSAIKEAGGNPRDPMGFWDSYNPATFFPTATNYLTGTGGGSMVSQAQGNVAAPTQTAMPRTPPPQAVVDPNNLPAPIFRYR